MMAHIKSVLGRIVRLLPPTQIIDGYEHPELVEMLFRKAADAVPDRRWDVSEGRSTVLDFGGGFGQHYKCAALVSPNVRWAVVETPAIVQRAAPLATDKLRFFTEVRDAAAWLGRTDLMHSDGAIHYAPDPASQIEALCAVGATEMLWKRTALSPTDRTEVDEQSSRLDENGPQASTLVVSRKLVRYRRTRIPERVFLEKHAGYRLAERSGDNFRFVR
jgi:hypothetical protein